ncbi:hypothetical protein J11TS1_29200 [Oceanobacillus sp. J11TS1]|nr:hypothetical protein J11TS1_29200 [Oceanobacillus sp. J11TS1]
MFPSINKCIQNPVRVIVYLNAGLYIFKESRSNGEVRSMVIEMLVISFENIFGIQKLD